MKWEDWELEDIEDALDNIEDGASIASQVKILWEGERIYRSEVSIRRKLYELKRARKKEEKKEKELDIEKAMKEAGLFAVPLNNGDWAVGKANTVYHMNVGSNHYEDERLAIAPTLKEAIQKWKLKH